MYQNIYVRNNACQLVDRFEGSKSTGLSYYYVFGLILEIQVQLNNLVLNYPWASFVLVFVAPPLLTPNPTSYPKSTRTNEHAQIGVTLWEIFTFGEKPYDQIETAQVKTHILSGGRLPQPDICTLDLYQVMIRCEFRICSLPVLFRSL